MPKGAPAKRFLTCRGVGCRQSGPSGMEVAAANSPATQRSRPSLGAPTDGFMRVTVKNTFVEVEVAEAQVLPEHSLHERGASTCTARLSTGAAPALLLPPRSGVSPELLPPKAFSVPFLSPPASPRSSGEPASPQPCWDSPALALTPCWHSAPAAALGAGAGTEVPGAPGGAGGPDRSSEGTPTQVLVPVVLNVDAGLAAALPEAPRCLSAVLAGSSADVERGHLVLQVRIVLATEHGTSTPSSSSCPSTCASQPPALGAAESPPSGSSQASPAQQTLVCCHWKNKGWCRYQDSCKFLHPAHKRGVGAKSPAALGPSASLARPAGSEARARRRASRPSAGCTVASTAAPPPASFSAASLGLSGP
mmetsp:Transcript_138027/g.428982  ORF Transcript_138027/g.428982 Transcript_138027/m.428982 type:complete len:364 (-) Transcript_138027:27-1118(-)